MNASQITVATTGSAKIGEKPISFCWATVGRGMVDGKWQDGEWQDGECTFRSITIPHPDGKHSITFTQNFSHGDDPPYIAYKIARRDKGATIAHAGEIDESTAQEIREAWAACEQALTAAQENPALMADYTEPAVTYGETNGVKIIAQTRWLAPVQYAFLQKLMQASNAAIKAMSAYPPASPNPA